MNPTPTQLEELTQMRSLFGTLFGTTKMASKQELEVILKAIIQIVKQLQDKNDTFATTLLTRFQEIKTELHKKGSDILKLNDKLNGEIKKMVGMIPDVPDIMPLDNRLSALEDKKELTMEEVMAKMPKDHMQEMQMMMREMQEMKAKVIELEKRPIGGRVGGGRKVPIIKRFNLTSQVNGSAKTFSLPRDTVDVVGVFGTQFPINFNPGIDWTFEGNTLTLTDAVGAPQTGQTLYAIIETLFYG